MSWATSVAGRIPGMKPGHTTRNVIIAVVALIAIILLPLTVFALMFIVPILLAFNVRGLRDRLDTSLLSRLPGLTDERRYVLGGAAFLYLFIAFVVVGAAWPGFAPAGNNSTATNASAVDATTDSRQHAGIEIVNSTDANGDGQYEAFDILVRANTTLKGADGESDAGEPYFAVQVNGQWQFDTPEVARETEFSTTIPMNASVVPDDASGELNVTVRLLDRDVVFSDGIARWSTTVPYSPAETPTPTSTPTPTATPTSTPSATATPTSASTSSSAETSSPTTTSTATPSPSPTTTSTATPTATPTPEPAVSVPAGISGGEARRATVTRVIDGDTVEVEFADGETDTIRLIGVDTPETTLSRTDPAEFEGIPESQAGKDHLYNWGQQAEQYANERLSGKQVRVVTDSEGDRRGSFGRLLAYIYVGGENFNRALLDEGYARMYDSTFSLREEFESAESQAQSNNVGLWDYDGPSGTPTPTATPQPDNGDDSNGLETPTPSGGASDPYDCGDFNSQAQAQQWFDNNNPGEDPAGLDRNDNDQACEDSFD